ncbi:MAG: sporulation protein YqfD [Clostridia bacterium]|nr:sporulation protein YqfD [Clostridia bacterium]
MRYRITGYNIDNFLKILYQKKVVLFNVNREGNTLTFEAKDSDDKKINRYIKNFKIDEKSNKKIRLKRFFVANISVILAVFLGSIFSIFASNYIWQIKIYGAENLNKSDIISVLKENGVSVGKLNTKTRDEITKILMNSYDRIAQASVIKKGTAIFINISEKLVYEDTEFAPITAKYAGIVENINLSTGTLNVKVGDFVNVGDVLVLPFNINQNGDKISVEPKAEVCGKVFVTKTIAVPKIEKKLVRTGKTKKYYKYKLWNFDLFSGKSKKMFAIFEYELYNENISDLVPFNRDVIVYHELKEVEVVHDFDAEKQRVLEQSKQKAYGLVSSGQKILDLNQIVDIIQDTLYVTTMITCQGAIH